MFGFLGLIASGCAGEIEQRETVSPISPTSTVTPKTSLSPTTPATPTPPAAVSPSPITKPLTELVGQTVTVSTKVQREISPNLFAVYDKESLRGQTVLVTSKDKAPPIGPILS